MPNHKKLISAASNAVNKIRCFDYYKHLEKAAFTQLQKYFENYNYAVKSK